MAIRVKSNARWIVTFVLIFVLAVGLLAVSAKLNDTITTETLKVSAWKIGGVDSEDGEVYESNASMYTKEYIAVEDIKSVEVAENAEITYVVYFYDATKDYLGCMEDLTETLTSEMIEQMKSELLEGTSDDAQYVRIAIIPNDGGEVTLLNRNGYAKQLTVTVNK